MTNQFSQEYVAFILSDEAKGLQKLWEPVVGDWTWCQSSQWQYPVPDGPVLISSDVGLTMQSVESQKDYRERFPEGSGYLWLPMLWQLLQIIEGAGYHWMETLISNKQGYRVRYYAYIERHETEAYFDTMEYEPLLAAAKLAVRAIGEGK